MKDWYLEYFEISRLLAILEKNLFRASAISNSVLTNSSFSDKFILLQLSYQEMMVLLSPKKVFYQGYLFHLSLQNISFQIFSKVRRSGAFVLYIRFYFAPFCF